MTNVLKEIFKLVSREAKGLTKDKACVEFQLVEDTERELRRGRVSALSSVQGFKPVEPCLIARCRNFDCLTRA